MGKFGKKRLPVNTERISVIDVAAEFGMDKRTIFKMLKRLGIETFMERSDVSDHRGQAIAHISLDDLESLRQELGSRGVASTDSQSESDDPDYIPVETGVFYLVQLEPEHDPGRFKVGFAVSIAERLRAHRCAAPFAIVVKTWPCRRVWERTAIDCVTAGCEQIHTEVFRACDLGGVVASCDQFFAIMPELIANARPADSANAEEDAEAERE